MDIFSQNQYFPMLNNVYNLGFSTIINGSFLLDAARSDSDTDIVFIFPRLVLESPHSSECESCKGEFLYMGKFCSKHDQIFGIKNENSLYSFLKRALERDFVSFFR